MKRILNHHYLQGYAKEKDWAKIISVGFLLATIIAFTLSVYYFYHQSIRSTVLAQGIQTNGQIWDTSHETICPPMDQKTGDRFCDLTDERTKEKAKIKPLQYVHTATRRVVITAYNSVQEQTDADFCIAANGQDICKPNNKLWCAYNGVAFGTRIVVPGFGECEVVDRLNKRYGQTRIDLYFGKDIKKALRWGKKELTVTIIYPI